MAVAGELLSNTVASESELDVARLRDLLEDLSTPIDTVDQSVQDAAAANQRAEARANRMQSRYGVQLTPAERQQQAKLAQFSGQSNIVSAGNLARRRDEGANLNRLGLLSNLVSRERAGLFGSLGRLAGIESARRTAYEQARAGAKKQQYGFLGRIGSTIGSIVGSFI
jgi:hypothetical protein|tara:strand:- start:1892 stop:2395 length:504 start_codon:yes stop_codon:yes gene_type:complete